MPLMSIDGDSLKRQFDSATHYQYITDLLYNKLVVYADVA